MGSVRFVVAATRARCALCCVGEGELRESKPGFQTCQVQLETVDPTGTSESNQVRDLETLRDKPLQP